MGRGGAVQVILHCARRGDVGNDGPGYTDAAAQAVCTEPRGEGGEECPCRSDGVARGAT